MAENIESFYGKLSQECLDSMDRLLLKLQELNKDKLGRHKIPRDEIAPLPDKEYLELWGYLRHCCHLASSWPNKMSAIKVIANKRGMSFKEVQDEAVDSMTIHCYVYAWRHYQHSEDSSAYVLSTAKFGWLSWIEEQNNYHLGIEDAVEKARLEARRCGHKVCNIDKS